MEKSQVPVAEGEPRRAGLATFVVLASAHTRVPQAVGFVVAVALGLCRSGLGNKLLPTPK